MKTNPNISLRQRFQLMISRNKLWKAKNMKRAQDKALKEREDKEKYQKEEKH